MLPQKLWWFPYLSSREQDERGAVHSRNVPRNDVMFQWIMTILFPLSLWARSSRPRDSRWIIDLWEKKCFFVDGTVSDLYHVHSCPRLDDGTGWVSATLGKRLCFYAEVPPKKFKQTCLQWEDLILMERWGCLEGQRARKRSYSTLENKFPHNIANA